MMGERISRFEDLIAWQKARELAKNIYKITKQGEFYKDFGLRDQIRRASVSIMSNLGLWNRYMFYVYILKSLADGGFYFGCTKDLKSRMKAHISRLVKSTRNRLPIHLIYYEACLDKNDAFHRERYLKTTYGRRYLRHRLKGYFTGWTEGFERGGRSEFHQFLVIAKGSCAELRSQLYVVLDNDYIDDITFQNIDLLAREVSRLVGGLRAAVYRQKMKNKWFLCHFSVLSPQSSVLWSFYYSYPYYCSQERLTTIQIRSRSRITRSTMHCWETPWAA